jgi:hypothetical protein
MRHFSIRAGGADTAVGIALPDPNKSSIGHNAGQQMSLLDPKQSEVQYSEAGSKEPLAAAEASRGILRIVRQYQQSGDAARTFSAAVMYIVATIMYIEKAKAFLLVRDDGDLRNEAVVRNEASSKRGFRKARD